MNTYDNNNQSETALHKAVNDSISDHLPQKLIDAGADVNAQDEDGWTPLHLAVATNKLSIVRCLLKVKGINVNATTTDRAVRGGVFFLDGSTALHIAAQRGFVTIAQDLLEADAAKDVIDDSDDTPLILAACYGHSAVVGLLIRYGANLSIGGLDGLTALHRAMQKGCVESGRMLIGAGAHVDARGDAQSTPLHWAVYYDHFDAVKLLIEHKASLDVHDRLKHTPLCLAKRFGNTSIIDLLRKSGARDEACECEDCLESR